MKPSDQLWRDQCAQRPRWMRGSEYVDTTDGVGQRGARERIGRAHGCESHSATDQGPADIQATGLAGSNPAPSTFNSAADAGASGRATPDAARGPFWRRRMWWWW